MLFRSRIFFLNSSDLRCKTLLLCHTLLLAYRCGKRYETGKNREKNDRDTVASVKAVNNSVKEKHNITENRCNILVKEVIHILSPLFFATLFFFRRNGVITSLK